MSFVVYINGLILMFFAAFMAVDAIIFSETANVFWLSAVLIGLLGAFLSMASSSSLNEFHRLHTFLLTSSVWITAAFAGAMPLYLWNLSPIDAYFEAMSGVTTTGSTVMSGLDTTPKGIILWRAILQAMGGIGFIVAGIALLPILKVGGMQLFRSESSDKGEKELRNATAFATMTLQVYLGLIAACALTYLAGGMDVFDAITHAMTTLSTGGYSGYDASFGHFESPFLQWAATLFMLAGAMPFAWYIRVVFGKSIRSDQVVAMLYSLFGVITVLTVWLVVSNDVAPLDALRLVAFNVISVVSTTGYATSDYTTWGPFFVAVFFFLTAVGGSAGSTAGGVKAMRWLIFWRAGLAHIKAVQAPNRVTTIKYEGTRVSEDVINGVVTFFVFFVATFLGMTIILAMLGLDIATAASGALTALANVGPGVGPIIGPAGNFATLSDPVKTVLIVGMYLGRLEMVTVFVIFTRSFWREVPT